MPAPVIKPGKPKETSKAIKPGKPKDKKGDKDTQ